MLYCFLGFCLGLVRDWLDIPSRFLRETPAFTGNGRSILEENSDETRGVHLAFFGYTLVF